MKQPNLPCDAGVGDIIGSIACGYHNQKCPWKSWFKRTSRLLVKVPKPNTVACNRWRRKSPESSQITYLLFLHYYDAQDFSFQNFFLFFFLKSCTVPVTFHYNWEVNIFILICATRKFHLIILVRFSHSVISCPTLCDPMDCSTPSFPIHHQLPELAQTHVHRVGDTIQPSHPLWSPFSLTFNLSQYQGLFQWVSSSHQMAKILEFQLRHQSFQWIFRNDFI